MKYVTELVSFALAAVLLLYAGLSPVFEGRPVHLPFLLLGIISVVLLIAVGIKARRESGSARR